MTHILALWLLVSIHLCGLQVLVEQVTGAVDMTFFHAPLINAYQNLSNVMLRIQPRGWQPAVNDTLLLNAHYDSPIGSTGERPTAQSLSNCLGKLFEVGRSKCRGATTVGPAIRQQTTSVPARLMELGNKQ